MEQDGARLMQMLTNLEERHNALNQAHATVQELLGGMKFDELPDALSVAEERRRELDQSLHDMRELAGNLPSAQYREALMMAGQRVEDQVAGISGTLEKVEALVSRHAEVQANLDLLEAVSVEEMADRLRQRDNEFTRAADTVQALVAAGASDAIPAAFSVASEHYEALAETLQNLRVLIQGDSRLLADLNHLQDRVGKLWGGLQTLVMLTRPDQGATGVG